MELPPLPRRFPPPADLFEFRAGGLAQIEGNISGLRESLIAFDYRQVLDVDRASRQGQPDHEATPGSTPGNVVETLVEQTGANVELLICSCIEESPATRRNLLTAVVKSQLPVKYVVITKERTGPCGKLCCLRLLTGNQVILLDDNTEILQEFQAQHFPCFQMRKPRASVVVPNRLAFWKPLSVKPCQHGKCGSFGFMRA